jgi:enoyl-CoA hydratase/carnithine racemase
VSYVITERQGRALTVKLNNPPYNFLNAPMVKELQALLKSLKGDDTVGAVIVTSAVDGIFISHYDVDEIVSVSERMGLRSGPRLAAAGLRFTAAAERVPGMRRLLERTPAAGLVTLRRLHDVLRRMRTLDKVFIAAINGRAYGGGCEFAMACDIRLIADGELEEGYGIGQPEVLVGLIPGGGGTQMLPRSVGIARALEIMLEGRQLSPREAVEIGLVSRAVAPAELIAEAHAAAERLARRPAASVAAIKRAVYEGATAPLEAGLRVEQAYMLSVCSMPRSQRAMRSYLDEIRRYEQLGDTLLTPDKMEPWREGRAIDLVD